MSQPAHNRVLIRTARPLGARPQEFFVSPQRIHWSHRFHPVLPSPSASPRLRLGGVPIKIRVKPSSLQILSPFLSVVPCFQICVHLCLSVVEKIRVNSWNTRQTPFPVLFLCVSASAVHPVRKTPAISFSKICENPSKTPHRQAWSTLIFFSPGPWPSNRKIPRQPPALRAGPSPMLQLARPGCPRLAFLGFFAGLQDSVSPPAERKPGKSH
jgi:hypothetical protein